MTDITINGWRLFLHPLFLAQYRAMIAAVRHDRANDPENYKTRRNAKLLAATMKMAFEEIPADPSHSRFRMGGTLGESYKHWFRGKYVAQYRLFFRFSAKDRIIILAWVNDENTKRAYESPTDAYRVFAKMLKQGHPPDDWQGLLTEAQAATKALADGNLGA